MLPVRVMAPGEINSLDQLRNGFPDLNWKEMEPPEGGRIIFAVLAKKPDPDRKREPGWIKVLVAGEDAWAPPHEHTAGGDYGESLIQLSGTLEQVYPSPDGSGWLQLETGQKMILAGGTKHRPGGQFWVTFYDQPRGSVDCPLAEIAVPIG